MPGLHFVQGVLQVIAALVKGFLIYLFFCTGKGLNTVLCKHSATEHSFHCIPS